MAPVPHRGKPCHCGHLTHIVEKIAAIKQIDISTVYETTRKNTFNMFGIYIFVLYYFISYLQFPLFCLKVLCTLLQYFSF